MFAAADHDLAATISQPDAFAFIVAFCAGAGGDRRNADEHADQGPAWPS